MSSSFSLRSPRGLRSSLLIHQHLILTYDGIKSSRDVILVGEIHWPVQDLDQLVTEIRQTDQTHVLRAQYDEIVIAVLVVVPSCARTEKIDALDVVANGYGTYDIPQLIQREILAPLT